MRHLYGIDKQAAQKKQAFAKQLVDFMKAQRKEAQQKRAAADPRNKVLALLRQAGEKK